jgi:hypothetical protein
MAILVHGEPDRIGIRSRGSKHYILCFVMGFLASVFPFLVAMQIFDILQTHWNINVMGSMSRNSLTPI